MNDPMVLTRYILVCQTHKFKYLMSKLLHYYFYEEAQNKQRYGIQGIFVLLLIKVLPLPLCI